MNDHINPVFAGIIAAANARLDATPAGAVPVPRELPRQPQYACRAGQQNGAPYQCAWCQGFHSREDHRGWPKLYCSNACEIAEDGGR